jgi:Skp family chaperone for outer membrane proteins
MKKIILAAALLVAALAPATARATSPIGVINFTRPEFIVWEMHEQEVGHGSRTAFHQCS